MYIESSIESCVASYPVKPHVIATRGKPHNEATAWECSYILFI